MPTHLLVKISKDSGLPRFSLKVGPVDPQPPSNATDNKEVSE